MFVESGFQSQVCKCKYEVQFARAYAGICTTGMLLVHCQKTETLFNLLTNQNLPIDFDNKYWMLTENCRQPVYRVTWHIKQRCGIV